MERREALKYTAVMMGAALSAGTISAILNGCDIDVSDSWKPAFFTPEEIKFISTLGDVMLPKTNTPGAKDAMVERYIDTIRPLRYTEEENLKFKTDLSEFIAMAKSEIGNDFQKVSTAEQLQWLEVYDHKAYELVKDKPDMPAEEKPFYLSLKALILAGYFSSEVVAKEYFAWDPIPGRYDACIPYEEIGKAWAL